MSKPCNPICLDEEYLGRRCREVCAMCLLKKGEGFNSEDCYELKDEYKHEDDE
jgi:hypothetical protein